MVRDYYIKVRNVSHVQRQNGPQETKSSDIWFRKNDLRR